MKLLRTTTTDKTGVFKTYLNQDLVLPPDSQIALGQLSAALERDELTIDGSNDLFRFSLVDSGVYRDVYMPHGSYGVSNSSELLTTLEAKINQSLATVDVNTDKISNPSNIGKQGRVIRGNNGKISIDFFQSQSSPYNVEQALNAYNANSGAGNVPQVVFTGTHPNILMKSSASTGTDTGFKHSTFHNHPICKGCGVHRVRIKKLQGTAADQAGFTIGLTKTNPQTYLKGSGSREMNITDINYGISCLNPFGADVYQIIEEGSASNTTVTPKNPKDGTSGTSENDVVSIEVVGGAIRLVVYQENGTNEPDVQLLGEIPYNGTDEYWATTTIHGNNTMALGDLRFTPEPFRVHKQTAPSLAGFDSEYIGGLLGSSTPASQTTPLLKCKILFPDRFVSNWFGYEDLQYQVKAIKKPSNINNGVSFPADNIFKPQIPNDTYILELLNLQLESYDTFQGQRKNILGIIPYDEESTEQITYNASNLVFLDLNNKQSINLTSLNMRLVRSDYSTPDLTGQTSAVIYFRPKTERM
tara:strand:- start:856 stop:2439 length:1584 start_codon:yes stop_codon:yes gene_type:complete